jgi:electron transfer flavoprotein beta subunit
MAAKKKPVEELTVADLGIDAAAVGQAGARQETVAVTDAEARQAGEVVTDEGDAFQRVVDYLAELKVI